MNRHRRMQGLLAAVVALMVLATAACASGPASASRVDAQTLAVDPGRWFMALTDGSVIQRTPGSTDPARVVLPPWSVQPSPDLTSPGEQVGAREIAFDPATRLLWYGDTHAAIRSINVDSGASGPALTRFADFSVVGCGIVSNARHMAIDVVHRQLIVPTLLGSVLFYDLDTMRPARALTAGFFGDVVLGGFRHFASDPVTGKLWYTSAHGDFVEVDVDRGEKTGRTVPLSEQDHGLPYAYRELAIDSARDALVYRTADNRLAAVDLQTLQPQPSVVAQPIEGLGAIAYEPR